MKIQKLLGLAQILLFIASSATPLAAKAQNAPLYQGFTVNNQEQGEWLKQQNGLPEYKSGDVHFQMKDINHINLDPQGLQIRRDGGSNGGGGTGIACFPTAAQAALVRAEPEHRASDILKQATSLTLTEYAYYKNLQFAQPLVGENAEAYLSRILKNNLMPLSQPLYELILSAIHQVSLPKSENHAQLKQLNDVGDLPQALPNNCALVQVAIRYSQTMSDGSVHAQVNLDRGLYEHLGFNQKRGQIDLSQQVIQQAMLQLHEALYLLGTQLGQKTSEGARAVSAMLLSQATFDSMSRYSSQYGGTSITTPGAAAMEILYIFSFNDFAEIPYLTFKGTLNSDKWEIKKAYLSLQSKILNSSIPCLLDGKTSLQSLWSSDQTYKRVICDLKMEFEVIPTMTPTEAFVSIAMSKFETGQINFLNILDPSVNASEESRVTCAEAENTWNADHLSNDFSPYGYENMDVLNYLKMMSLKTLDYCQSHGLYHKVHIDSIMRENYTSKSQN